MLKPKTETPKGKPAEQTTELWGLSPQDAIFVAAAEADAAILQASIDRGAKVNRRDKDGMTPIMHVGASDRIPSTHEEQVEATRTLIKNGANVHAQDGRGTTPLMWSALNGTSGVMQELLENPTNPKNRANPNDRNKDGQTALMFVRSAKMADMLLNHRADINAKDEYGYTPLMYAIEQGNMEVAELLVQRGARLDIKNNNGKTAADVLEDMSRDPENSHLSKDYDRLRSSMEEKSAGASHRLRSSGVDITHSQAEAARAPSQKNNYGR